MNDEADENKVRDSLPEEALWRLSTQLMVGELQLVSVNKYPAWNKELELTRRYANKPGKTMCSAWGDNRICKEKVNEAVRSCIKILSGIV